MNLMLRVAFEHLRVKFGHLRDMPVLLCVILEQVTAADTCNIEY